MGEPLLNAGRRAGGLRRRSATAIASAWAQRHIDDQHERRRAGHRAAHRAAAGSTRWRCRSTPRARSCATCSCPSTGATRSTRSSRAAGEYAEVTGRRVTYEMVMIDGINDTAADARATAALLRATLAHVNLIPMNPVAHTPWQPQPPERVEAFAAILRARRAGHDGAPQSRHRHRCGLRAAGRRARRSSRRPRPSRAVASSSCAAARRPWQRHRQRWRARRACSPKAGHERRATARAGRVAASLAGHRTASHRGEHPERRLRPPRPRRPQARAGRRGPPPPRCHGRPLRAQPHLRAGRRGGLPARSRACRSTSTS